MKKRFWSVFLVTLTALLLFACGDAQPAPQSQTTEETISRETKEQNPSPEESKTDETAPPETEENETVTEESEPSEEETATEEGEEGASNVHTHQFAKWVTIQEPSCVDVGQTERSCSCGLTETKFLDTVPHTYRSVGSSQKTYTCSVCNHSFTAPAVLEPLTWDRINAIPIATDDMTSDQLRKICDDMMRLNLSFQWTPNEAIQYYLPSHKKDMKFSVNTVYAGVPYGSPDGGSGNVYTWMEYYNSSTGVLDLSTIRSDGVASILSNHCSSSCFWAWSRVVNTLTRVSTHTSEGWINQYAVAKYGFIPVAPFSYSADLAHWSAEYDTGDACKANGEQIIYQAYANVKLADGLQGWLRGSSGSEGNHIQMVAGNSIVVKNPDGTINGKESFVIIHEQTSSPKNVQTESGKQVTMVGRVDRRISFEVLYKAGYVPFTFAEFLKQDPVEKGEATLDFSADSATYDQLKNATLKANYAISGITVKVFDASGREIYRFNAHPPYTNTIEYSLQHVITFDVQRLAEREGCRIEILSRISTGEELTVYQGLLVDE